MEVVYTGSACGRLPSPGSGSGIRAARGPKPIAAASRIYSCREGDRIRACRAWRGAGDGAGQAKYRRGCAVCCMVYA